MPGNGNVRHGMGQREAATLPLPRTRTQLLNLILQSPPRSGKLHLRSWKSQRQQEKMPDCWSTTQYNGKSPLNLWRRD